jgi:hypothetical protein
MKPRFMLRASEGCIDKVANPEKLNSIEHTKTALPVRDSKATETL